jgi:hypothetical protein
MQCRRKAIRRKNLIYKAGKAAASCVLAFFSIIKFQLQEDIESKPTKAYAP